MSRKNKHQPVGEPSAAKAAVDSSSKWRDEAPTVQRRDFPVAEGRDEAARIAITAGAYADVVSHAKENLDEEVCGVLVGELCEDQFGTWVLASGAIRGTSARQGGAHVTYTQETWETIHQVKDRDFPKLAIVGWYHTHPGFGVEFSDMDRFIQRNFFAGPAQFALVIDPIGGEEAICVNAADGIRDVRRFWVDGRQRKCWAPAPEPAAGSVPAASADVERKLAEIERRLSQVLQATEEERTRNGRFITAAGMLVAFATVLWICSIVLGTLFRPLPTPPQMDNWVPVPIMVDGREVMLGVSINRWNVPPELNAALVELERRRAEMATLTPADKQTAVEPAPDAKPGFSWFNVLPFVLLAAVCVLLAVAVAVPTLRGMKRRKRSK